MNEYVSVFTSQGFKKYFSLKVLMDILLNFIPFLTQLYLKSGKMLIFLHSCEGLFCNNKNQLYQEKKKRFQSSTKFIKIQLSKAMSVRQ